MDNELFTLEKTNSKSDKHSKCKGSFDELTGEADCDYNTELECDECKYGFGRKDPEAKCNQF